MNIGDAARASGVSAKMIRYYESVALIAPAARRASGYRDYCEADLHVLRFVRRARDLGFPMEKVADLLALWRDRGRASADVKRLAEDQIEALETRIREMVEMKAVLEHLAHSCAGNERPDCPILDDLGGKGSATHCSAKTN